MFFNEARLEEQRADLAGRFDVVDPSRLRDHARLVRRPKVAQYAGAQVEAGNLAGAIATLEKLGAPIRPVVNPWIDLAKQRLKADATVDRLTKLVSARAQAVKS